MKLIVIGGVAAGMSAASKLKRMNKESQVVVYEKGGFLSYGACGLPYYISGENNDYTKMIARTKEQFEQAGMDIFLKHEVIKIVPEKKQILVRDIVNQTMFIDSYDQLIITTGARAIFPTFPGSDLENIHCLKSLEDGIYLKEKISSEEIKDVVVVGGGYIGIEVAEAMSQQGKNVRIIELADRVLTNFEPEITELTEKEILRNNVKLNLNEQVIEFIGTKKVEQVKTNLGTYKADLVVMAVGVKPATEFLKDSGIMLAKNGAVVIDREMRTSVEDIYSAGDCAQVYNKISKENTYIPLGTNANKQGRIAGVNISGKHDKYTGTLGSAAIKVFDMELGRTGLTIRDAENLAIDYDSVFVESSDHPAYYPNQTSICIKIIYEKKTKRILGVHAIGNKGVVLRIDVFAVAIHNKMTTDELGMTDLCYAPPFAGVWDAIHIASNAAK